MPKSNSKQNFPQQKYILNLNIKSVIYEIKLKIYMDLKILEIASDTENNKNIKN